MNKISEMKPIPTLNMTLLQEKERYIVYALFTLPNMRVPQQ
jgi:hypothetical protein